MQTTEPHLKTPLSIESLAFWSALVLLGFFFGQFMIMEIAENQSTQQGLNTLHENTTRWVNWAILASSMIALVCIAIATRRTHTSLFGPLPWHFKTLLWMLAVVLLSIVLNLLSQQLLNVFQWQPDDQFSDYLLAGRHQLLTWIAVGLMAPVFEELFFRGFVYTHLMSYRHGLIAAITVPNLVWCLLHFHQYDLIGLAVLLMMGVIFTLVRWLGGHLIYPLLMHVAFNLTTLFVVSLK